MNILEKKIEDRFYFWSILGPMVVLLSLAVLFVKLSSHWVFPIAAIVATPLCLKWKMKGFMISLAILLIGGILTYQTLHLEERYWYVGMGLAMTLSLLILALSFEEVENLLHQLQVESQSRLSNFLRLDEKFKVSTTDWQTEKAYYEKEMSSLVQKMALVESEAQTAHKLKDLAKDELIMLREQHQKLTEDLLMKKVQISQQKEHVEEMENTIQSLVNTDTEKQLKRISEEKNQLETQFSTLLQECKVIRQNEQQSQEKCQKQLKEIVEQCSQEKESLLRTSKAEYEKIHHELRQAKQDIQRYAQEKIEDQSKEEQLKLKLQEIEKELMGLKAKEPKNSNPIGHTRTFEDMYLQLKQQFQEKSDLLDSTRKNLFKVQEHLIGLQKENEQKDVFEQAEEDWIVLKNFEQACRELDALKNEYHQEIYELHALIDKLMKR